MAKIEEKKICYDKYTNRWKEADLGVCLNFDKYVCKNNYDINTNPSSVNNTDICKLSKTTKFNRVMNNMYIPEKNVGLGLLSMIPSALKETTGSILRGVARKVTHTNEWHKQANEETLNEDNFALVANKQNYLVHYLPKYLYTPDKNIMEDELKNLLLFEAPNVNDIKQKFVQMYGQIFSISEYKSIYPSASGGNSIIDFSPKNKLVLLIIAPQTQGGKSRKGRKSRHAKKSVKRRRQ